MAGWIIGRTAPVHPTYIAGKYQRPLETWRRKHAVPARGLDLIPAPRNILWSRPPCIVRRNFLRHQGDGREGLRRPTLLAWNITLRHRPLLYRKQRNAGEPVEHEDMAHFCIDDDRRRTVFPGEERGLRSYVIVPKVMVNHLKAPHQLARGGA